MAKHKDEEEIADLTPEETAILEGTPTVGAAGETVGGPLRQRLGIFRRRAVAALVKKGVERSVAIESVGQLGDGKILDWIIAHGPEIMEFVKMIIALFALL